MPNLLGGSSLPCGLADHCVPLGVAGSAEGPPVCAASALRHSVILPPQDASGTSLGPDPCVDPVTSTASPGHRVRGLENQQLSLEGIHRPTVTTDIQGVHGPNL